MARIDSIAVAMAFVLSHGLAAQGPDQVPSRGAVQSKLDVEKKGGKKKVQKKTLETWQGYKFRKDHKKITSRIKRAKALMDRKGILQSHIKVRVRLRNGESMQGVVRNGVFVEKSTRFEFVRADMKVKGAGLRIWYYNGTDGYIFIPYTQIRTYRILKQLSEIEVIKIRDTIRERETALKAEAAARLKMLADKKAAREKKKQTGSKLDELSKKATDEQKSLEEGKRLLALFAEYPPSAGWGGKKLQELQMRKTSLGVFPNAKETRFIEQYEDWQKGFVIWKALNPKKAAQLEQLLDESGSKGSKKGAGGKE